MKLYRAAVLTSAALLSACSSAAATHTPGSTHSPRFSSGPPPSGFAPTDPPSYKLPDPYATPTTRSFTITLKILSRQCFGSAGCNISYRPQVAVNMPAGSLNPAVTYDVTYEVDGGDSGPVTDTLQVQNWQYSPTDQEISTASQSARLTVRVVSVSAE